MDHLNRFCTRPVFTLLRLEYAVALIISITLAIAHIHQIRWIPFIALFLYIDLIGYLPGAIAYRRSSTGNIGRTYYVLYNLMHSMAVQAIAAALWCALVKPEWALLAIPVHLCGDRALFGNFVKSFAVPFEPVTIPQFEDFERQLNQQVQPHRAADAVSSPA